MAHVRFQLKQVNGKSQIYFGDGVFILQFLWKNVFNVFFSFLLEVLDITIVCSLILFYLWKVDLVYN